MASFLHLGTRLTNQEALTTFIASPLLPEDITTEVEDTHNLRRMNRRGLNQWQQSVGAQPLGVLAELRRLRLAHLSSPVLARSLGAVEPRQAQNHHSIIDGVPPTSSKVGDCQRIPFAVSHRVSGGHPTCHTSRGSEASKFGIRGWIKVGRSKPDAREKNLTVAPVFSNIYMRLLV